MSQAPQQTPPPSLDQRVADLERLLAAVIARAQTHPAGRRILAYLGLKS